MCMCEFRNLFAGIDRVHVGAHALIGGLGAQRNLACHAADGDFCRRGARLRRIV